MLKAQADQNRQNAIVESAKAAAVAEVTAEKARMYDKNPHQIYLAATESKKKAILDRKAANKAVKEAEQKVQQAEKKVHESAKNLKQSKKAYAAKDTPENLAQVKNSETALEVLKKERENIQKDMIEAQDNLKAAEEREKVKVEAAQTALSQMKAARQQKQQEVQALFQQYQNAQKELEASD